MNLFKFQTLLFIFLCIFNTKQHVCTDQVLSPIIVKRTLGQGSQGKAEEVVMNRKQYVLKTFLDKGCKSENLYEASMHKYLSSADSQQQNVVKYELCFKKDGNYQLLMEYFSSNWDSSYYRTEIMKKDIKERAKIYKSLIQKVHFMHQQGIMHCDLKPDNIFCDIRNISDFKIGDFGLSKKLDPKNNVIKCSAGALGYIAPETNKALIKASDFGKYDMFSIGIIIAQVESNRTCDILERSKNLQNKLFNDISYGEFLQRVEDCLPKQSSQNQKFINNLIIGLLIKNENKRLDEQSAYQILDQVIYDIPQQINMQFHQQNAQILSDKISQKQSKRQYEVVMNRFDLYRPVKPIHDLSKFQNNAIQKVQKNNEENPNNFPKQNFQQKNKIIPNQFFQQQIQKSSVKKQQQQYKRNNSQDSVIRKMPNNMFQQMQPQMKQRGISNRQQARNKLLAKRNESNDIWGVMKQQKRILI